MKVKKRRKLTPRMSQKRIEYAKEVLLYKIFTSESYLSGEFYDCYPEPKIKFFNGKKTYVVNISNDNITIEEQ